MATTKKPWADGPFELISSSRTGLKEGEKVVGTQTITVEMIIVHNFVLRGINSIYNQCIKVQDSPDDIADFVNYAIVWGQGVEEHHHGEEHEFFPAIEEKAGVPGLMSANVEQHKMFHDGLEQYNKYLTSVRDGKEAFIGQKLKNIIDAFMPVLRQHLSDEIDTLQGLRKYEDKLDWGKWFNEFQEEILKKAQTDEFKTTVFPWAVQNHDKTFEGGVFAHWPPLPWIVGVLMRWFFMPKHKSWWRFAPCDYYGKPKDLPFA